MIFSLFLLLNLTKNPGHYTQNRHKKTLEEGRLIKDLRTKGMTQWVLILPDTSQTWSWRTQQPWNANLHRQQGHPLPACSLKSKDEERRSLPRPKILGNDHSTRVTSYKTLWAVGSRKPSSWSKGRSGEEIQRRSCLVEKTVLTFQTFSSTIVGLCVCVVWGCVYCFFSFVEISLCFLQNAVELLEAVKGK